MRDISLNGKWLSTYGGYLGQDISFDPPTVKEKRVDMPANHGSLDLTESLTGEPLYNDRVLTFPVFFNLSHLDYVLKVNEMTADLHGKRVNIIFDNDPQWRLEGRCEVTYAPWKGYGEIKLSFTCKPFRYALTERSWSGTGVVTMTNQGSISLIPMVVTTGTRTITYPNTSGGTTTRTVTAGQWKFSDLKLLPNVTLSVTVTGGTAEFRGREVRL